MSGDDKFKQKDTTSEDDTPQEDGDKSQLNRTLGTYIPKTTVYSFTLGVSAIGFIIGAILFGGLIVGLLCLFDLVGTMTQGLQSATGGTGIGSSDALQKEIINQGKQCAINSTFSPIGILSFLFGGIVGALPAYSTAKRIKNGELLRSIL